MPAKNIVLASIKKEWMQNLIHSAVKLNGRLYNFKDYFYVVIVKLEQAGCPYTFIYLDFL